jgi:hypothetical protein
LLFGPMAVVARSDGVAKPVKQSWLWFTKHAR